MPRSNHNKIRISNQRGNYRNSYANTENKQHPPVNAKQAVILSMLCVITLGMVMIRYLGEQLLPEPVYVTAEPWQTVVDGQIVVTPEPTPVPTPEPEPEDFVLTFIGDCTLNSGPNFLQSVHGYAAKMNGNYAYPFKNTVQYFENDEYTFANLECTFSDTKLTSYDQFYFLCPTAYVNILTEGKVDFVTTANNHMNDFGDRGVESTLAVLNEAGIAYGKDNETTIVTTPNGIKIGVYCVNAIGTTIPDSVKKSAVSAVKTLKQQNVDLIVCAMHWSKELYYSPFDDQVDLAHKLIDAGADIIWGSHPHCLQPIEEYGSGVIMYSAGNFSFGGNTRPTDPDTAIFRITVTRQPNGSVVFSGIDIVPCCVSSNLSAGDRTYDNYNDYCPTPYIEGTSGYGRVYSKLDGSFKPDKEGADYSNYYASWS